MGLYFENATPSPIWVAYGHSSEYSWCDAGWYKKGWYKVGPGSTAKVWSGSIGGHCFVYYAEDDFGHVWAGPYTTFVPWNAFYLCWEDQSGAGKVLGFRYFCVPWIYLNYTKRLIL
jgi:uncharacterized membrane protein